MNIKGKFLLLFLGLSTAMTLHAQYIKIPFDSRHFWFCEAVSVATGYEYDVSYRLSRTGETTINNKVYQIIEIRDIVYTKFGAAYGEGPYIFRQDTVLQRVYALDDWNDTSEVVFYDFKRQVGDTSSGYPLLAIDSVLLGDGKYHLRQEYGVGFGSQFVVEGIGCLNGFGAFGMEFFESSVTLNCVFDISTTTAIYESSPDQNCSATVGLQSATRCQVRVSPNPAREQIHLTVCEPAYRIEIRNVMGRVLISKLADQNTISLDIAELPVGSYFVSVRTNTGEYNQHFIKAN